MVEEDPEEVLEALEELLSELATAAADEALLASELEEAELEPEREAELEAELDAELETELLAAALLASDDVEDCAIATAAKRATTRDLICILTERETRWEGRLVRSVGRVESVGGWASGQYEEEEQTGARRFCFWAGLNSRPRMFGVSGSPSATKRRASRQRSFRLWLPMANGSAPAVDVHLRRCHWL